MPKTETTNCPECGDKLTLHQQPEETTLLSVFGLELVFRRWIDNPSCVECDSAKQDARYERTFNDGVDIGFQKGFKRGLRDA